MGEIGMMLHLSLARASIAPEAIPDVADREEPALPVPEVRDAGVVLAAPARSSIPECITGLVSHSASTVTY
jgi:hypothetical protein